MKKESKTMLLLLLAILAVSVTMILAIRVFYMHRPSASKHTRIPEDDMKRLHTISAAAAVSLYTTPMTLIEMGDTYAAGIYPQYAPDPDVARALFVRAATHPSTRATAMAKMETVKHTRADVTHEDVPLLPEVFATHVITLPVLRDVQNPRPATAMQNVHDHAVTRSVKKTLRSLVPQQPSSYEQVATDIRRHILEEWEASDAQAKTNALNVLDAIMGTDAGYKLDSVGCSEKDAMTKVWGTVSEVDDPELKKNVRDTFIASLADAVDPTALTPVCPTGRVVKMVAALDGTDVAAVHDTVDMYAVRQELMNIAAQVRDSQGDEVDTSEIKGVFRERVKRDYVDGLGMESDVLEPLIQEMEAGF